MGLFVINANRNLSGNSRRWHYWFGYVTGLPIKFMPAQFTTHSTKLSSVENLILTSMLAVQRSTQSPSMFHVTIRNLLLISCQNLCQERLIFVPGKQGKQVTIYLSHSCIISWYGTQQSYFMVKPKISSSLSTVVR